VWCGRMDKVAAVTRITHPMVDKEDICEVQCSTGKSYQFKTTNIAGEVENTKSKKLKTMNLRKARKW
jgi:hypothetical protein